MNENFIDDHMDELRASVMMMKTIGGESCTNLPFLVVKNTFGCYHCGGLDFISIFNTLYNTSHLFVVKSTF